MRDEGTFARGDLQGRHSFVTVLLLGPAKTASQRRSFLAFHSIPKVLWYSESSGAVLEGQ